MTDQNKPVKTFVPVADKIAQLELEKETLNTQLNSAPEDQKAGLSEQIAEKDRKIRWYQGRANSTKFQAREASQAKKAAEAPATPATESTSDPRNG